MKKILNCNCSGCAACYNVCPKQCIKMKENEEGFLYPSIAEVDCIDCGLCNKACPVLNEYKGHERGKAYACINNDETVRLNSSSGGIFTLLAEYVLDMDGIVFGAAFDNDLSVRHIEISDKNDISLLRGSKYLQSRIGDTYKSVKKYLEGERTVLFTGTPCQISGLKKYLNKEYDNLLLQDIICHGVPSPMVWQKYLSWIERNKCKICRTITPNFRDKKNGWSKYGLKIHGKDNDFEEPMNTNLYMRTFLQNWCLRESCYDCHSKSLRRESDVTLADFWGIDKVLPEFDDDKGTSLVFVNSEKGRRVFEEIRDSIRCKEVNMEDAIKYNTSAYKSVEKSDKRNKLFELFNAGIDFDKVVNELSKESLMRKILRKVKRIIKNL